MSTPTSTPDNNEPEEHREEPIDPTRTFDAYFEKQNPPAAPLGSPPEHESITARDQADVGLTTGSPLDETVQPASYSEPFAPGVRSPGPDPSTSFAPREANEPQVVRMRTVVLGLVLLVIAGAVLVGQLTDITVDAGTVLLALMIGGGLLLIAGARRP